jgi:ankyrin repeat protein
MRAASGSDRPGAADGCGHPVHDGRVRWLAAHRGANPARTRLIAALTVLLACAPGCARPPMNNDAFSEPAVAPLADAVRRGDAAEVRRQLERVDPDTPGADGASLLVEGIGKGQLDSVQALLDAGADPNRPGQGGETPVHAAAFADDPALLRAVLAHGGQPDVRNRITGATPLVAAILGGNAEQLQILLDAGADPNLADLNDDAPLHSAARTNAGAAILALLRHGASPLAQNSGGATFQDYYFAYGRGRLNARALAERREIVAWLKANAVPLGAGVDADD